MSAPQTTAPLTSAAEPGAVDRRPASESVPRGVRVAAAFAWRLLLISVAVAVLAIVMAYTKVIWVPVLLALLLTVLLSPAVDLLVRRARVPRGVASGLAVVVLLGVVTGLVVLAGREIAQGVGELWTQAQAGFDELLGSLAASPLGVDQAQIDAYLDQAQDQLSANSGTLVSGAVSVTTTVGHVLAGAVVTLFCLFFFLKDGSLIWTWMLRLLPMRSREAAFEASRRGVITLGAFTRTQILVAAIDAVGIGVGAAILGIPLALPLAVLVFLASFIPFVGAIATGAIAVLVALVDQGAGTALIMLAIVLGVQQLEGHVLQPLLLGHAVSLHPVAVLLGVTAGSLAAGIVGALFAVPLLATLNTVVLYLHGHDKFPSLGRDEAGFAARMRRLNGGPVDDPGVAA
ncbi:MULTISPECIES: AI-2E family transporter [unclassified Actinotalea]|uniref:AI-2E family transporter n=1 Tax=unclassified Actinotalea TaxID=2638618 RepID=UPI0015F6146B|nr:MULTISPECIES: AI-2E family transporter [unclassified Actinotalea]